MADICSAEEVVVTDFPAQVTLAEQKDAIKFYQGEGHSVLNEALRSGAELPDDLALQVHNLLGAASAAQKDTTFYRGILYNNPLFDELKNASVGTVYSDAGFLSMTTDQAFADMVSGAAHYGQGVSGYTFEIQVRRGSQIIKVDDKLMHEFILPPGSKLKLIRGGPNALFEVIL